jgi:hypothetical protein
MQPALLADVTATEVLSGRALFENKSQVWTGRFLVARGQLKTPLRPESGIIGPLLTRRPLAF